MCVNKYHIKSAMHSPHTLVMFDIATDRIGLWIQVEINIVVNKYTNTHANKQTNRVLANRSAWNCWPKNFKRNTNMCIEICKSLQCKYLRLFSHNMAIYIFSPFSLLLQTKLFERPILLVCVHVTLLLLLFLMLIYTQWRRAIKHSSECRCQIQPITCIKDIYTYTSTVRIFCVWER